MEPPRLWLDTQNSPDMPDEKEPNVWEVSTTFSPSPGSKHITMNLPSDSSGSIQHAPVTMRPAVPPLKPVPIRKTATPKRIAPPPPKKSKRKKQNKMSVNTTYDVPAPYLEPISSTGAQQSPRENERVYDVPKRQRKWKKWHVYKEIDVSKVQPPNPYADLAIKPTT